MEVQSYSVNRQTVNLTFSETHNINGDKEKAAFLFSSIIAFAKFSCDVPLR